MNPDLSLTDDLRRVLREATRTVDPDLVDLDRVHGLTRRDQQRRLALTLTLAVLVVVVITLNAARPWTTADPPLPGKTPRPSPTAPTPDPSSSARRRRTARPASFAPRGKGGPRETDGGHAWMIVFVNGGEACTLGVRPVLLADSSELPLAPAAAGNLGGTVARAARRCRPVRPDE